MQHRVNALASAAKLAGLSALQAAGKLILVVSLVHLIAYNNVCHHMNSLEQSRAVMFLSPAESAGRGRAGPGALDPGFRNVVRQLGSHETSVYSPTG